MIFSLIVKLKIRFNEEKNLLLKEARGICFTDVIESLINGDLLDVIEHHNKKKYPNQKIMVLKINNYIYMCPYIINQNRKTIFLKTVYPNRKFTSKYLRRKS